MRFLLILIHFTVGFSTGCEALKQNSLMLGLASAGLILTAYCLFRGGKDYAEDFSTTHRSS